MNPVNQLIKDIKKSKNYKEVRLKAFKWLVIIGLIWIAMTALHIKLSLG